MGQLFSPEVRKWIYGVSLAVIPLLIAFGVLKTEDAALWVALAAAVFNQGLAFSNVDTSKTPVVADEDGAVTVGSVFFLLALVCVILGVVVAATDSKLLLAPLEWFVLAIAFNTMGAWEG